MKIFKILSVLGGRSTGSKGRQGLCARARQGGSSLVEISIASFVMVVALGGILMMTVNNGRLSKAEEQVQVALATCRNKIEEIRSLPIEKVPELDGVGFRAHGAKTGFLLPLPDDVDGLPGEIEIVEQDRNGANVTYRVRSTLRWMGTTGAQEFFLMGLVGSRRVK